MRAVESVNPEEPETDSGLTRDADKLAGDGDKFGDEDEKEKDKNSGGDKQQKKESKRVGTCT